VLNIERHANSISNSVRHVYWVSNIEISPRDISICTGGLASPLCRGSTCADAPIPDSLPAPPLCSPPVYLRRRSARRRFAPLKLLPSFFPSLPSIDYRTWHVLLM
jgi:hypothetical protein